MFQIFDMRRFKSAVERESGQKEPDAKQLLLKTCVRVALVKDGADMAKTPCWFMIINIVALDMLKTKIPEVLHSSERRSTAHFCSRPPRTRLKSVGDERGAKSPTSNSARHLLECSADASPGCRGLPSTSGTTEPVSLC